jgi:hypothetical protein
MPSLTVQHGTGTAESGVPRGRSDPPEPPEPLELSESPVRPVSSAGKVGAPGKVVATGLDLILDRLDEAAAAEADANRAHARSGAALAAVVRLARANPHLYLRPAGLGQKDALELAEDAAAFDAGLRLHLSSGQVRTRAHDAQTLHDRLPRLNAVFTAGGTTLAHVRSALELVTGWTDDTNVDVFDAQAAATAVALTPAQFRVRARRLKEKLLAEPAEARHVRAFADRRVVVEPDDDGMAWLHLLLSAPDAVRIAARLNATARAEQKKTPHDQPGWRSRDQHRADLAAGWLAGDGTLNRTGFGRRSVFTRTGFPGRDSDGIPTRIRSVFGSRSRSGFSAD